MGEAILITSGKGGVGKTTTTANLGAALGALGKRTVLIDTDIGLRNLDLLMGLESDVTFDLLDAAQGRCPLEQAILPAAQAEGLFLMAAAQTVDKSAVTATQMRYLVGELKRTFDYVLIDSPAGIEQGFRNAAAAADRAVVVTNPEKAAVRDGDRVIGLLEEQGVADIRLLVNRYRADLQKKGVQMPLAELLDIMSVNLIGVVPEDGVIAECAARGAFAAQTASPAATAYQNIARRICGETVELMDLKPKNWLLRLFSKK